MNELVANGTNRFVHAYHAFLFDSSRARQIWMCCLLSSSAIYVHSHEYDISDLSVCNVMFIVEREKHFKTVVYSVKEMFLFIGYTNIYGRQNSSYECVYQFERVKSSYN